MVAATVAAGIGAVEAEVAAVKEGTAEGAVPPPQKRPASTEGGFATRRARLLERVPARAAAAAGVGSLSSAEEALERVVLRPALAAAHIDPAKCFLEHKADYDKSDLLPLLRRMPKGAVLHTHSVASADFSELVALLQESGRFYVWQGDSTVIEGSMRSFAAGATIEKGWVPTQSCTKELLYGYLTLSPKLPSVAACWEEFGKLWDRIRLVSCVAPFYFGRGGVLWSILRSYKESNVVYAEIKEPIYTPWIEYDGRELSDNESLELFCDTVRAFRGEHPGFLGARLVPTALKCQSEADVREAYRRAAAMKARAPDFVAGFDLAGPEDAWQPISAFAAVLEEEKAAAVARGVDLPLLLHAGETNVPEATQIFDAVALGCERIGHGFALARHPPLIEEVLASGASLECCPISNQVLGYCPNLANHAALGLLRAGVPLTISPDDPGMWHYSDVSYDFAAVAKAWHLGLLELKALARNSLCCSTLRGQQKEEALQSWQGHWDAWVKEELQRAGYVGEQQHAKQAQ